jgi:hypothetical protein
LGFAAVSVIPVFVLSVLAAGLLAPRAHRQVPRVAEGSPLRRSS